METLIHIGKLLTDSFYRNLYLDLKHRPLLFRAVVNRVKKIRALTDGLKTLTHEIHGDHILIYIKVKQNAYEHFESYSKQKPYWIDDELYINIRKEMAKLSKNVSHIENKGRS